MILSKLLETEDKSEISCFSFPVYGKIKKHRIAKQLSHLNFLYIGIRTSQAAVKGSEEN